MTNNRQDAPNLPGTWTEETTTARAIADSLFAKVGKVLPWATVRAAIDGALQGKLLERIVDSVPWPCDFARANEVRLRAPEQKPPIDVVKRKDEPVTTIEGVLAATTYLSPSQIQDLADQIDAISSVAVGYDLKIAVRIEVGGAGRRPPEDVVARLNAKLGEVSQDFKLK